MGKKIPAQIVATPVLTVQASAEHCVAGVQLLTELVTEMNQADSFRGLSRHRKVFPLSALESCCGHCPFGCSPWTSRKQARLKVQVASSFRDEALLNIFEVALSLTRKAATISSVPFPMPREGPVPRLCVLSVLGASPACVMCVFQALIITRLSASCCSSFAPAWYVRMN